MHLIVYEKKVYVYVYVCRCIRHAGLQQHRTIAFSKARIPQDASACRSKRGGEPSQQAVSWMAVV